MPGVQGVMPIKITLLIVAMLTAIDARPVRFASGADLPSSQPTRPYRLVLRGFVDGDRFKQVFVIVSPEGEPFLSSYAELTRTIERVVHVPATLDWEPNDAKVGREPLDDSAELKALADFCRAQQIKLVVIPAG